MSRVLIFVALVFLSGFKSDSLLGKQPSVVFKEDGYDCRLMRIDGDFSSKYGFCTSCDSERCVITANKNSTPESKKANWTIVSYKTIPPINKDEVFVNMFCSKSGSFVERSIVLAKFTNTPTYNNAVRLWEYDIDANSIEEGSTDGVSCINSDFGAD